MLFLLLKWLHVLAAIVAVGANVSSGFWSAWASRDTMALPFTFRGIKWIDDRIANPAYGVLLVTGLAMVECRGSGLALQHHKTGDRSSHSKKNRWENKMCDCRT